MEVGWVSRTTVCNCVEVTCCSFQVVKLLNEIILCQRHAFPIFPPFTLPSKTASQFQATANMELAGI